MGDVTPVYGFRYQTLTDAPHGPNLGENGFTDVENKIVTMDAAIAAASAKVDDVPFGHAGRTGTFETISAANGAYVTLAQQQLKNGMAFSSNGLVVPRAGLYEVAINAYATGFTGGVPYQAKFAAVVNSVALPVPGANLLCQGFIPKQNTSDYTGFMSVRRQLAQSDVVRLWMQSPDQTWGSTGYDGSYLELTYLCP